jgi:hypothetical protein
VHVDRDRVRADIAQGEARKPRDRLDVEAPPDLVEVRVADVAVGWGGMIARSLNERPSSRER